MQQYTSKQSLSQKPRKVPGGHLKCLNELLKSHVSVLVGDHTVPSLTHGEHSSAELTLRWQLSRLWESCSKEETPWLKTRNNSNEMYHPIAKRSKSMQGLKPIDQGAEEIAWRLRPLAVLLEDTSLVPNTHVLEQPGTPWDQTLSSGLCRHLHSYACTCPETCN